MSDLLNGLYSKRQNEVLNTALEPDCDWSREYPVIYQFLTCNSHGGRPRELGTILMMFEGGKCKAWVNDKHSGLSAFVSADSYTALYVAIEMGLGSNSLEWRAPRSKASGGFGGRK